MATVRFLSYGPVALFRDDAPFLRRYNP